MIHQGLLPRWPRDLPCQQMPAAPHVYISGTFVHLLEAYTPVKSTELRSSAGTEDALTSFACQAVGKMSDSRMTFLSGRWLGILRRLTSAARPTRRQRQRFIRTVCGRLVLAHIIILRAAAHHMGRARTVPGHQGSHLLRMEARNRGRLELRMNYRIPGWHGSAQ